MTILDTSRITTEVRITEADLRRRLIREVQQALGLLDEDGDPIPGVSGDVVHYGDSRSPHNCGYAIRITCDMSPSPDKALTASEDEP